MPASSYPCIDDETWIEMAHMKTSLGFKFDRYDEVDGVELESK